MNDNKAKLINGFFNKSIPELIEEVLDTEDYTEKEKEELRKRFGVKDSGDTDTPEYIEIFRRRGY